MNHLFLNSEQVSPTGNVTSKGIINQLGRPKLSLLEVLVREAVQNSWDAKDLKSTAPVKFGMAGWTLNPKQRQILAQNIFGACPSNTNLPLQSYLKSSKELTVLAVYDRGTVGLRGPTRADAYDGDDGLWDFVDFLRNVGQPPEKQLSGGTYGFGKAAFYRASCARTIIVHTRCLYKGTLESRFIAAALGSPFTERGIRYTGRHWWGQKVGYRGLEIAEPMLNGTADKIAGLLGMPKFLGDERGTTILVLQPAFSEEDEQGQPLSTESVKKRTPKQAMNLMAEYLLWYFWPKMMAYEGTGPAMHFEVSWEGEHIPIPDPSTYPPLHGFVEAMRHLKASESRDNPPFRHRKIEIASQKPKQHLGCLALHQFFGSSERAFDTGEESKFNRIINHTALMRAPELVVKYLPGDMIQNEQVGYSGVFITDKQVDDVFAESEPPTHDDWVAEALEQSKHRTFVRVAQRRIKEEMDSFAKPSSTGTKMPLFTPLGAFSNKLGNTLLLGQIGSAATSKVYPMRVSVNNPVQNSLDSGPKTQSPYKPFQPVNQDDFSSPNPFNRPSDQSVSPENFPKDAKATLPSAPTFQGSVSSQESQKLSGESTSPFNNQLSRSKIIGRARVHVFDDGEFVLIEGAPSLQIQFSVTHAKNADGTLIRAQPRAVLDGSSTETEPPVGGSLPKVLRWISPEGNEYAGSEEIYIPAAVKGNWFVIVSVPEDVMLSVDLSAEAKAK